MSTQPREILEKIEFSNEKARSAELMLRKFERLEHRSASLDDEKSLRARKRNVEE